MKYIFQNKCVFHKTRLMQISGLLSYQKTKSADQLFDCEFNTEKSDGSVAIAVKEVSDSCAAAVCLTQAMNPHTKVDLKCIFRVI